MYQSHFCQQAGGCCISIARTLLKYGGLATGIIHLSSSFPKVEQWLSNLITLEESVTLVIYFIPCRMLLPEKRMSSTRKTTMKNRPSITEEEDHKNKEVPDICLERTTVHYLMNLFVNLRKEILIMKTKLKDMFLADWLRVAILLGFLLWIVGEMTGVIEHRGM